MKQGTIYDIAAKLNLSPATVSRALNGKGVVTPTTTERVLKAADEIGYSLNHYARNLRNGANTKLLGVIFHKLNSEFSISVLSGIEKTTRQNGYDIIICHSLENYSMEINNATNLLQRRVDGLIIGLTSDADSVDHLENYIKNNIPVILFDRVKDNFPGIKVVIDNYQAAYKATEHLIHQGCRSIVHIRGSLTSTIYKERLKGYKDALSDNNILFDPRFVISKGKDPMPSTGLVDQILALAPQADGIFAVNDITAVICMKELINRGLKVPDDIAIVGFNNDLLGNLVEPALSTINYPGFKMGEMVANALIDEIEKRSPTKSDHTLQIKSSLIIRASSMRKDKNAHNQL